MCENNFTSSQLIIYFITMYQFFLSGGIYFFLYKIYQSNLPQNKNNYSKYNYSKYNLLLNDYELADESSNSDSTDSESPSSDSPSSDSNTLDSPSSDSNTLDIDGDDEDDNEYAEEDDDDTSDYDESFDKHTQSVKPFDTDINKKNYKYINRIQKSDFNLSYISDSDSDNNFVNKKTYSKNKICLFPKKKDEINLDVSSVNDIENNNKKSL